MTRDRKKQASEESGGEVEERRRVLMHASSLNRSDIIKKVVARQPSSLLPGGGNQQQDAASAESVTSAAGAPSSRDGDHENVDREVLDHVDEEGLTALHYAVRKSSLDVSYSSPIVAQFLSGCTAFPLCAAGIGPTRHCLVSLPRLCTTKPLPASRRGRGVVAKTDTRRYRPDPSRS